MRHSLDNIFEINDKTRYWISISQVKIASEPVALYDSNLRRDSGMILGE